MRLTTLLLVMLLVPVAAAHAGEEQFNETEELIAQDIPCSELTEDQLVEIGDYYMEQMHPGEMHEVMDEHMGGEGSESLRDAHLHMADRLYCDTDTVHTSQRDGWMPRMGVGGNAAYMGGTGWAGLLLPGALLVLAVLGIIYLSRRIPQQGEDND